MEAKAALYLMIANVEAALEPWIVPVIGLLAIIVVWLAWRVQTLTRRLTVAMGGSDSQLEETLGAYFKNVKTIDAKLGKLTDAYKQLAAMTGLAAQKISIVRFNPFGDTGGDQSFALAVLDSHNSGYVLTSIHGREGTRIYVKPVDFGKSKYTLSAEEQRALAQAAKRVPRLGKDKQDG